jgi:uncharacterized protein YjeT (DUF2065 family)
MAPQERASSRRIATVIMILAGAVVVLAAFYLLGFGALAVVVPARASVYLHGFARSAGVHVLELVARVGVGAAFLRYSSHMEFSGVFQFFGLILIITTLVLAVLPWRWHQRFAQTSVPAARPYLREIGIMSIAAGVFVFWAAANGFAG